MHIVMQGDMEMVNENVVKMVVLLKLQIHHYHVTSLMQCDCPKGLYGPYCNQTCPQCGLNQFCVDGSLGNGQCACLPGTLRHELEFNSYCECAPTTYGNQCQNTCRSTCPDLNSHCFDTIHGNGTCICNQCNLGIIGIDKSTSFQDQLCDCISNIWGPTCNFQCPKICPKRSKCSEGINGTGERICELPFIMNLNKTQCICPLNTYGNQCQYQRLNCTDPLSHSDDGEFGAGNCICISPYILRNFSNYSQCDCLPNYFWNRLFI